MDARKENEPTPMTNRTTVERKSERELVVTRTFNGPARIVFEAWTKPELFRRWWAPKSMGMSVRSCEMDVRVGGQYRLEFEPDAMALFGTYLEVTPHSRLVWTNEEGGEGGPVTTVTFEEKGGKTLLVMHELYASKVAGRELFRRSCATVLPCHGDPVRLTKSASPRTAGDVDRDRTTDLRARAG